MADIVKQKKQGPKGTDSFKATILKHLEQRAEEDTLFAKTFEKENKNIDECIAYIFTTVKATGCTGFTEDEVYQMAVHYYDEDEIKIGDLSINGSVIVNHSIQLSDDEISKAKDEARERIYREERERMTTKKRKKSITSTPAELKHHSKGSQLDKAQRSQEQDSTISNQPLLF